MKAAKRIVFSIILGCLCWDIGMWVSRRVAIDMGEVYLAWVTVFNIVMSLAIGLVYWIFLVLGDWHEEKNEKV